MKLKTSILAGAIAMACAAVPAAALAQHHGWHGWHDRDIGRFHDRDFGVWRGGYWNHGWHGGHFAWWWVVGPQWYFYDRPIRPYPDPYRPSVVIPQSPNYGQPAPSGPPPQQNWYYCDNPKGYYPYIDHCSREWRAVPANPNG